MRHAGPEAITSDAPGTPPQIDARRWSTVQALLGLIAVVLVVGALHQGRAFFIPLVLGLLLATVVWPVHEWLARRVWRGVAATLVTLLLLVVVGAVAAALWYAGSTAARWIGRSSDRLLQLADQGRRWLQERGLEFGGAAGAPPGQGGAGAGRLEIPASVSQWLASFLTSGLGSAAWVVVIVSLGGFLMVLLLIEAPRWDRRLERVLSPEGESRVRRTIAEAAGQVRRFVVAKTVVGVIAGVLVGLWCWAMGVPSPFLWGLLQLLFNYIPNIGAFVSGVPATLVAMLELGPWAGLGVGAGLLVIETLTGNLLEPLLEGNVLRLSPFVVLAALVFWGAIWGATGAILAVPITSTIVVVLLNAPRLRPLGELLEDRHEPRRPRRRRARLDRDGEGL